MPQPPSSEQQQYMQTQGITAHLQSTRQPSLSPEINHQMFVSPVSIQGSDYGVFTTRLPMEIQQMLFDPACQGFSESIDTTHMSGQETSSLPFDYSFGYLSEKQGYPNPHFDAMKQSFGSLDTILAPNALDFSQGNLEGHSRNTDYPQVSPLADDCFADFKGVGFASNGGNIAPDSEWASLADETPFDDHTT
jgi:hypothetical protein